MSRAQQHLTAGFVDENHFKSISERTYGGVPLQSKGRRYLSSYCVLVIAVGWFVFTVWYSFGTSSGNTSKIFSKPSTTILVLTALSHGASMIVKQLINQSCENTRWMMGSSVSGIRVTTFLGLSRATSSLGVLKLCFFSEGSWCHRSWCLQRYPFPFLSCQRLL